jgi:hypothetical protein
MSRSHVRYARICFDSHLKIFWTPLVIYHPWVLNLLFSFTGHPDSSSRQGSFKEHQSPHPSSSPVGCRPWRYKEDHRPTCSPEALPEAQFWFVARIAAPCPEMGFTFVPEEAKHMEKQSAVTLGSRVIASRGTGFESPIFSAHCCDMSRAAPDGRRP